MSKKKKKNNSPKKDVKIEKQIEETKEEKKVKVDEKKQNKKVDIKEENVSKRSEREIPSERKIVKHPLIHSFLVILLLTSLAYFIISLFYTETDSLSTLGNSLLLMLFTILFVSVSITTNRKNKSGFFFSSLVLFIYFVFGIAMSVNVISFPNNKVINFTGKSLSEVIKWSEKYKIDIVQDYEYSDMIEEYHIISQDIKDGTKIKDVKSIKVAISEGPNPSKEIVVPNMVTWDYERVLDFIKENHLSNVEVEFIESSKEVNTVIEQSKSGNLKRDEKLQLIFSYGMELGYEETKLKDLAGVSKFEATFYLKQHQLKYEFEEIFSNDVKRGFVVKQSVKAGTMVKVNNETIKVYISKGPEIKIPNFKNMSMSEITDWVIKNKLKLEFSDKYDDSVKENLVVSANYSEGQVVSEGTVIEVVISRGKLTMPEFDNYNDFRVWAEKYGVHYEEKHEFSNDVKAGEVISYSYKTGETIKNNDSVVVTLSDGKEVLVPNVVGSTKDQATTKLKNAGFGYSFVYSYSNSVAEGKVIRQSISAGSKVAQGTTVTVTISNGKKPVSSSSGSNNSGSSGGGSSSGGNTPSTVPTPTCNPITITIQSALNGGSVSETSANYRRAYPNAKFNFVSKPNAHGTNGMVHPDTTKLRELTGTTCDTFTIYIIQN